jgi:hypothetical protein
MPAAEEAIGKLQSTLLDLAQQRLKVRELFAVIEENTPEHEYLAFWEEGIEGRIEYTLKQLASLDK